jgi:Ca2+-binding EF-hand superfamily protein
MRFHRFIRRFLCLQVVIAAAFAQEAPLPTGGHAGNVFIGAWDTDGDGKVSRTEYDATRTQRFAQSDENSDAALSADEYVNEYATRLDHDIADARKDFIEQTHTRFRSLDKDGDGGVSRAEYDESGKRTFTQLDHNKDGRIAASDPDKAQPAARAEKAEEHVKVEKARPARARPVITMPTTHTRKGFLEIYDTDADEAVTRAQFDEQRASAFVKTDSNSDGKLDPNEYLEEFADRLDRRIARTREAQLKQGLVRFESIDADKNGGISRDEYLAMSARFFERADTNKDGTVADNDPPPPPEERRERSERTASSKANPI